MWFHLLVGCVFNPVYPFGANGTQAYISLVRRLEEGGGPERCFMMYVHMFPAIPSSQPGSTCAAVCEPVIAVLCYQSFPGMASSGRGISLHGQ